MASDAPGVSFHDFSAGGETGGLIREHDWAATRLGPRAAWPRNLGAHLSMILELPTAAIIFWGPDQVQLYNDGYAVIMGPRHPKYLGATFRECWPEAYSTIHPWMLKVLHDGETVEVNRTLVPLTRFGFTEEAYFTFSFSPLRDDDGTIAGILQLVTEVTDAVLGERRSAVLHELSEQTRLAKTTEDASRLAAQVLGNAAADLPFSLVYVVDPTDEQKLVLSGSTGSVEAFPRDIDLRRGDADPLPELRLAIRERRPVKVEGSTAVVFPILSVDRRSVVAVLVAGISARLRYDGRYESFIGLIAGQLASIMAAARAYDDERKRVEALTEIDRAKTEFFGNVSHEFRTPLTLILSPIEDALRDPSRALRGDALDAVHRNALRLLRLVNTLLDFARIEANRLTSAFEPTDLPILTAGIAGSFQSLFESAGLRLIVDCPPVGEPISVDRAQWEKILLNLISNAFKFTFEGQVGVRLHEQDGFVHLSVTDTGTGIPQAELPNLFKRFYRVPGARGRSFEGTGIGLALVDELARQHGGSIRVESTLGKGTTFTVSIPRRAERPTTTVSSSDAPVTAPAAAAYALEAAQWIGAAPERAAEAAAAQSEDATRASPTVTPASRARVLVADDNADMRAYLVRLLSPRWTVETAEDGQAALDAARRRPPDLVLSDVMMPRMNGVALLGALRADPSTSTVPVVLLSARAGEDAVVDGFETGADDYLVKPFAARELLARVQAHLEMARLRREWALELERANKELEAFSYSVSHDLRAPLRAIDGFSQALAAEYSSTLDGNALRYLERIRAGTRRMAQLIDDLLGLSRITRAPMARQRVDVTELARTTLTDLAEREPGRRVESVVAADLVAQADPRLTAVLLANLLGNAWKFSSGEPLARIEVGSMEHHGQAVFFVRDNGAGFDMQYAEKLFVPFQRLHAQADFEGTGIGLATVQRIVTRHGGRISADAAPGRGATFFFTLAPEAS